MSWRGTNNFSPEFSRQITELMAGKLMNKWDTGDFGTKRAKSSETQESHPEGGSQTSINEGFSGGTDGARTRDLQRDRLAF